MIGTTLSTGRLSGRTPVVFLVLALVMFVTQCSEEPSGPVQPSRYLLSGSVRVGGMGIRGIQVSCGDQLAQTDADGYYYFRTLPRGEYAIAPITSASAFFRWIFLPAMRHVTIRDSDVVTADFTASPQLATVRTCSLSVSGIDVFVKDGDTLGWRSFACSLSLPFLRMSRDSLWFSRTQSIPNGSENWSVIVHLDTTDGTVMGFQYSYSSYAYYPNPRFGYSNSSGELLKGNTVRFNPDSPFQYTVQGELGVVNVVSATAITGSYTSYSPDGSSSTRTVSTVDRRVSKDAQILLTLSP